MSDAVDHCSVGVEQNVAAEVGLIVVQEALTERGVGVEGRSFFVSEQRRLAPSPAVVARDPGKAMIVKLSGSYGKSISPSVITAVGNMSKISVTCTITVEISRKTRTTGASFRRFTALPH